MRSLDLTQQAAAKRMGITQPKVSDMMRGDFTNNILHLLALPALLACLVSHNRQLSRQRAREAIRGIYGLLRAELFLPWPAEELDAVIDHTEATLAARSSPT